MEVIPCFEMGCNEKEWAEVKKKGVALDGTKKGNSGWDERE